MKNVMVKQGKNMNMKKIDKKMDKVTVNKQTVDHPPVMAPQIDKLSGVVDLHDATMCGLAFGNILDWIQQKTPGMVKVTPSRKYQVAVDIRYPRDGGMLDSNCAAIRLEITSPKASKHQVRFEYNPRDLVQGDMEYVNAMFNQTFGVETFYELLYHARFTRVDWFRDIIGPDIEDYLIKSSWKKISQCFFGLNGKLQTITLGKAGNNQLIVYNKAAQLHGPDVDHGIIRIEARCRINMTILQLAAFDNPFKHVQVYSVGCKNPPFGVAHWRGFVDSCRLRGVGNAIKVQPVKCRSALRKTLSKQPVSWWQIAEEDWDFLVTNAIEDAGLTEIPNSAPPLTAAYHVGKAA